MAPAARLIQAEARSLDVHPGLPGGLQGPRHLHHQLLLFPGSISRELDQKWSIRTQMVITWDVGIAGGGFTQSATVVFWYKPEPVLFPEEVGSDSLQLLYCGVRK